MSMLAEGVRWFDDWFAVEELAPGVFAIGEPKYHQINWNYLIVGRERALMFDTGPGVRNIAEVAASLTKLPLTAMPSHMHYDHTGNLHRFDVLAMPDLPMLRQFEKDGKLHEPVEYFRGFRENIPWRPVTVSQWWPIGHIIDLGGVKLKIMHTPGHSPDSVSLFDAERKLLFAADFVYLGRLYGQTVGAFLPDYLATCERLLAELPLGTRIFGAHGQSDDDGLNRAPELEITDISDLKRVLESIRAGKISPVERKPLAYPVNSRMTLLAAQASFGAWQAPI